MIRLCRLFTNTWLSVDFETIGFNNNQSLVLPPQGLIDGMLIGVKWKFGPDWTAISATDRSGTSVIFENAENSAN